MGKNKAQALHQTPVRANLTEELFDALRGSGYRVSRKLVGRSVAIHRGRVAEANNECWPGVSYKELIRALREGGRVHRQPEFLHYNVYEVGDRIGIGCNMYAPAEILRVVAMSDRTIRNPKNRRTAVTTAIKRADGDMHVPLVVLADGSVSFPRFLGNGRIDPAAPLDHGQPRCPREVVTEIGRLAARKSKA